MLDDNMFLIRFWGARGSIAAPGKNTIKYGGNTSCVEVRCGSNIIIFDAGTGIRELGKHLLKDMPVKADIFISHVHWDHIQGFPFFSPAYTKGNSFNIYGLEQINIEKVLKSQMSNPNFPISVDDMSANIEFHNLITNDRVTLNNITIDYKQLNHPNTVIAFKVSYNGKSMVYATDTEHYNHIDPELYKLSKDSDVLIYDAQYIPEEYDGRIGVSKIGWGHSTWKAGVKIAKAANIKQLVLFHHDPSHSDAFIDKIKDEAQKSFHNTIAAYEGLEIILIPTNSKTS